MKLRFALTDTALRSAKPRAESYKMFDGGSLFVLVKPNGSMLWRYKFKLGGREKLLTLGQYPAVKLADARKAHQDAKIKLQAGVDPSAARQAERAGRQIAEAEAALRETTFGSVADKWLKTRVPVKAKGMEEKEIKKRFKTYARDDRMVGYLKDGKETAPGFGRVVINRVELGHLSPILKAVNHPTRIRLISAARKIISYAKARTAFGPKIAPRHSPISISPLALRSIGRRIGQRSPTPSNSASFSGRSKSMRGAVIT
jgi:hypothetical protein